MGSQIRLLAFGFIFEVKLEVEEGAFPSKNRHYYPPPPTTGTREAQMELSGTIWNARRATGTREALLPLL